MQRLIQVFVLIILSAKCYFCRTAGKLFLFLIILSFSTGFVPAQSFVKTSDIFRRSDNNSRSGRLNIIQNPAIDTLITRYILVNKSVIKEHGHYGMEGFRIQIYNSSNRNAREESNKTQAEFLNKFPDITNSIILFENPGYFKVRVGDFRTRTEAIKLFIKISREFPNAYIVPDFIYFPDLNTK